MGVITYQNNADINYDQWKLLRNDSLGSSEVGPVIYGNNFTCNLEIFWNKVAGPKDRDENIRMWLGKQTEDTTAKCWQYYDGSDGSIVKNHRAGTPVKQGINKKLTIFNSDYPGRSSTPDLFIQPFGKYANKGEGFCELKNTQSYVLNSYENNIPTDNLFQVCDQVMIGDVQYGELFYFVDNKFFVGHEFDRQTMKKMEAVIKSVTLPFWQSVLKARKLYNQSCEAKRNFNFKLVAELEAEIFKLEPPAQNTRGYEDFLTQRYKDRLTTGNTITGNDVYFAIAQKHRDIGKKIKKLEDEKRFLEIQLKEILKENNCIDFGKAGKVTWYGNKNGSRIFKNQTK